jgi:predicted membrane protein
LKSFHVVLIKVSILYTKNVQLVLKFTFITYSFIISYIYYSLIMYKVNKIYKKREKNNLSKKKKYIFI